MVFNNEIRLFVKYLDLKRFSLVTSVVLPTSSTFLSNSEVEVFRSSPRFHSIGKLPDCTHVVKVSKSDVGMGDSILGIRKWNIYEMFGGVLLRKLGSYYTQQVPSQTYLLMRNLRQRSFRLGYNKFVHTYIQFSSPILNSVSEFMWFWVKEKENENRGKGETLGKSLSSRT